MKVTIYLIVSFIFIGMLSLNTSATTEDNLQVRAIITEIESTNTEAIEKQIITVRVLEGKYKGSEIMIDYTPIYSSKKLHLRVGLRIGIQIYDELSSPTAYILNIDRSRELIQLAIIFVLIVLIFGRLKGISSLVSLILTGLIVIKIIIPCILMGYSPILVAVIASIFIIIISFLLISGFTIKSFVAIISTCGGTIIAGIFANYYTHLTALSGTSGEEITFLITELGVSLDFRGLFLSGIIIGTIGAIMDVSMSIVSCIFEIHKHSPRMSFIKLAASGFNVGKDVMSTMVNTLILAYAGAAMPLFLIFFNSNISIDLINNDILTGEIIRALSGSIGLILTIPITVFASSFMVKLSGN